MPHKDPVKRRAYQLAWERKKYATVKRIRIYTPEQKQRRKELERLRGPGPWDKSEAAKRYARTYARNWRASNPERMRASNKRCYKRNLERRPDCYRKYCRDWKAKNPDKSKDIARRSYINNKAARKAGCALWRKRNPSKVLAFSQAARARKRSATTEDCSKKIAVLKRERFCHWCCKALTPATVEIDHVVPLARHGKHCNDNLVASCRLCNSSRKAKLVSEWTWEEAA